MDEALPLGVRVDPIIDLGMKGLEQRAICLRRDERSLLRSKVGSGHVDDLHPITHHDMDLLQVL